MAEYTCPDGQASSCEDLRNSDGEYWRYRSVQCDQAQQAGAFVGNVDVGGGLSATGDIQGSHIYGNGAGLTNVTATGIDISCPGNYILQKTTGGWGCRALPPVPAFCQDGDFVGCYEGAPGTKDVGACTGGTRTCSEGVYWACEGQVVPVVEACNSVDDDCNGVVDDGQDGAVGCNQYYPDQDYDFFGDSSGQPVDWDWNCDGQWEKEYITVKDPSCHIEFVINGYECAGDGWGTSVPACGVTAGLDRLSV